MVYFDMSTRDKQRWRQNRAFCIGDNLRLRWRKRVKIYVIDGRWIIFTVYLHTFDASSEMTSVVTPSMADQERFCCVHSVFYISSFWGRGFFSSYSRLKTCRNIRFRLMRSNVAVISFVFFWSWVFLEIVLENPNNSDSGISCFLDQWRASPAFSWNYMLEWKWIKQEQLCNKHLEFDGC